MLHDFGLFYLCASIISGMGVGGAGFTKRGECALLSYSYMPDGWAFFVLISWVACCFIF